MEEEQKKKRIIWLIIWIAIFSIPMFFYSILTPKIYAILANNFSIISSKNSLMVHYISVGQGDSIAINLPDGKVMLIDTGPTSSNVTLTTYLNEKVFNGKRNKTIDYLVLTHADADHVGGALRVLENFDVNTIYMPDVASSTNTYTTLYNYIISQDYTLINNSVAAQIEGNGYTISFFAPVNYSSTNESCPLIKIEFMDYNFLFTGDITSSEEATFVSLYGDLLDCDVLKVSHHGSSTSTSAEFLATVTPTYAVISVGANNSYGHPTETVLNNLYSAGAEVLRTDSDGNVLFAVGKYYNLTLKTGSYTTTVAIFDYRIVIVIIDCIFIISIIKISIKKKKPKVDSKDDQTRWIHA